jgi:hypothetical protein
VYTEQKKAVHTKLLKLLIKLLYTRLRKLLKVAFPIRIYPPKVFVTFNVTPLARCHRLLKYAALCSQSPANNLARYEHSQKDVLGTRSGSRELALPPVNKENKTGIAPQTGQGLRLNLNYLWRILVDHGKRILNITFAIKNASQPKKNRSSESAGLFRGLTFSRLSLNVNRGTTRWPGSLALVNSPFTGLQTLSLHGRIHGHIYLFRLLPWKLNYFENLVHYSMRRKSFSQDNFETTHSKLSMMCGVLQAFSTKPLTYWCLSILQSMCSGYDYSAIILANWSVHIIKPIHLIKTLFMARFSHGQKKQINDSQSSYTLAYQLCTWRKHRNNRTAQRGGPKLTQVGTTMRPTLSDTRGSWGRT